MDSYSKINVVLTGKRLLEAAQERQRAWLRYVMVGSGCIVLSIPTLFVSIVYVQHEVRNSFQSLSLGITTMLEFPDLSNREFRLTYISIILRKLSADERMLTLRTMRASADSMAKILDDVLDLQVGAVSMCCPHSCNITLQRIEQGALKLNEAPMSLRKMVRHSARVMIMWASSKQARLVVHITTSLGFPPTSACRLSYVRPLIPDYLHASLATSIVSSSV
jgi:signal transduction histidine kinase